MSNPIPIRVVAEGAHDHLKSLQRVLARAEVAAQIVSPPPAQCSS